MAKKKVQPKIPRYAELPRMLGEATDGEIFAEIKRRHETAAMVVDGGGEMNMWFAGNKLSVIGLLVLSQEAAKAQFKDKPKQ